MSWESLGGLDSGQMPDDEEWIVFCYGMAKRYLLHLCGKPPEGCELDVFWQDHDYGSYPSLGLYREYDTSDADRYWNKCESALEKFNDAIDWSVIKPEWEDEEDENDEEEAKPYWWIPLYNQIALAVQIKDKEDYWEAIRMKLLDLILEATIAERKAALAPLEEFARMVEVENPMVMLNDLMANGSVAQMIMQGNPQTAQALTDEAEIKATIAEQENLNLGEFLAGNYIIEPYNSEPEKPKFGRLYAGLTGLEHINLDNIDAILDGTYEGVVDNDEPSEGNSPEIDALLDKIQDIFNDVSFSSGNYKRSDEVDGSGVEQDLS